jgi:hypothetical protein
MPQDPRVTEESLEYVDMFFEYVAGNCITELSELLDLLPDLIYARDQNENTALYCTVGMGKEEGLETARILMAHGAEPDASNVGIALQLIDEPHILHEMAKIMGINLNVHSNALRESDNAVANARAYLATGEVGKSETTLRKIEAPAKKKSFFSWNVQEIKYDNVLTDIFKNLPDLNMDQQKEVNKMTMNIDSLLKPTSFSLGLFEVAAVSDNLPLTLIPNEFLSYSYEQISHILGKMQNYFYGDNSSHEA